MNRKLKDLTKQEIKDLNRDFEFFYGGTFSQWKRCRFCENGIMFTSAEQYMMYHKAVLFDDLEIAKEILRTNHPSDIKKLGRLVKGFNQRIWDENKYRIVLNGNLLKFTQNPGLKVELLETGNRILVEASPYDDVWGIKLSEMDPRRYDPLNWRGKNLLGFALTEVKEVLREMGV